MTTWHFTLGISFGYLPRSLSKMEMMVSALHSADLTVSSTLRAFPRSLTLEQEWELDVSHNKWDQHMYPGGRKREERGMGQVRRDRKEWREKKLLCTGIAAITAIANTEEPRFFGHKGTAKIERCQRFWKKTRRECVLCKSKHLLHM